MLRSLADSRAGGVERGAMVDRSRLSLGANTLSIFDKCQIAKSLFEQLMQALQDQ